MALHTESSVQEGLSSMMSLDFKSAFAGLFLEAEAGANPPEDVSGQTIQVLLYWAMMAENQDLFERLRSKRC